MSASAFTSTSKGPNVTFESLEQRLMMTTLHGGETFIYRNQHGEMVRVDLSGRPEDAIELMAYDSLAGEIVDLPGLLFGAGMQQITWADGLPLVDWANGSTWAEYNATPSATPALSPRGSRAEIYAIYVANCTDQTNLHISTLSATSMTTAGWSISFNYFSSVNVPLGSPAGSGGAVVGAYWDPVFGTTPNYNRHLTAGTTDDSHTISFGDTFCTSPNPHVIPVPTNPMDPDVVIRAGITIAAGVAYRHVTGIGGPGVGQNVQSVAAVAGDAYVVDNSPFIARLVKDGSVAGLGVNVKALAANAAGLMFTANNAMMAAAITSGPVLGGNVSSLCSDSSGRFFAVDNSTNQLIRANSAGGVTVIGLMRDITGGLQYDLIDATDFNPVNGSMYAIAHVTDLLPSNPPAPSPASPYLVFVDPDTGICTAGPEITHATISGTTRFSTMAFAPDGTLYAVIEQTHQLITIDTTTGAATLIGVLNDGGTPLTSITGMDFVYGPTGAGTAGTLYISANDTIYTANTASAACTLYGAGMTGISGMTYNPVHAGELWVSVQSGPAYRLGRITMGSSLLSVNDTIGSAAWVASLRDSAESTFAFDDVVGADFNAAGTLYAIVNVKALNPAQTAAPAGRFLATINTTTGVVTRIAAINGAVTDLSSIAFNSAGVLYGVLAANNGLFTIDTATATASLVGNSPVAGFVGLQFCAVGGSEALFGLTASSLYSIDAAAPINTVLLSNTGRVDLTSLAFDATCPNVLWSTTVDNNYRLAMIPLSSQLVFCDATGNASTAATLTDSANAAYGYVGVHAMMYDAGTSLMYAVGTLMAMDPINSPLAGSAGPYLITIDTTTGIATRVVAAPLATDLTSITIDAGGVMWAVTTGDELVNVNLATGAFTGVATLSQTGIVGIDFDVTTPTDLYGVSVDAIWSIDTATGVCTKLQNIDVPHSTATGMSAITTNASEVYVTIELSGVYHLIAVDISPGAGKKDLGELQLYGTLAGTFENAGGGLTIGNIGYLAGKIDIGTNIDTIFLQKGSRAAMNGALESDGWIRAKGSIRQIDSRGGTMSSLVQAQNDPTVSDLSQEIVDLQGGIGTSHSSMKTAQFLSHPTGNFWLFGSSSGWYGLPLVAGQKVTISGGVNGHDTNIANLDTILNSGVQVYLRDSRGSIIDTLGFESQEDRGLFSRGSTAKPIIFTAPAADVYYIEIVGGGVAHTLQIENGTAANLGAVTSTGIDGGAASGLPGYDPNGVVEDFASISSLNGSSIGAVVAWANGSDPGYINGGCIRTFGSTVNASTIYAVMGESISSTMVVSDGNIGLVAANDALGYMVVGIEAGFGSGMWNHNSLVNNVRAAGDLLSGYLWSSGSIGVLDVGGTLHSCSISANADRIGPGSRIDLIRVGGDWGSLVTGRIPRLAHGPGGDIGHVSVAGTIHTVLNGVLQPATPVQYSDGRTTILNDDGGGRLTLTPTPVYDPATSTTFIPTYSFIYIGVDDYYNPGLGVGGVIAKLSIDGPVRMTTSGTVQISDLDLSTSSLGTVSIGGVGKVDVYYAHSSTSIGSFVNSTVGSLVSADFGGNVQELRLGGSIGPRSGSTPAWLPGRNAAPPSVVQYGWFYGTVNGVEAAGDINIVRVDGSMGDLRVLGVIGDVAVNADRITTIGGWDGVLGVIWSDQRINRIDVGDGLADDGGSDKARAGIFSTRSIGTIVVDGPRYVNNGWVFHELNGAIIAGQNDILLMPDPASPGSFIPTPVDGITEVLGRNGAFCTALIGVMNLDGWIAFSPWIPTAMGGIGRINFTGAGAEISGAEILAHYIREVSTSADGNGINYTTIMGMLAPANAPVIGKVEAGGEGIHHCQITANGGAIGPIRGLGATADIWRNGFYSNDGIASISGRHVYGNGLHTPGTVGSITATGYMDDNEAYVGAIGNMKVSGDFCRNNLRVAGELTSLIVGGKFDHSVLTLQGPTVANLKSLVVGGDITGEILSASRIGQIISQRGSILADITTLETGQAPDVQLIQAAGGCFGEIHIGGNLGKFISGSSLGSSPATNGGRTQKFEVWGTLGELKVVAGDLFADITVGRDIGLISLSGTLFGNLSANGNLSSLSIAGQMGGMLDMDSDGTAETKRGSIAVMGSIGSISLPSNKDIFADMSVGGSITGIALKGGSIKGNIESRYGSIGKISVTGGNIDGTLTAKSIGSVSVTDGNITQNIRTTAGSIKSITIKNGQLAADIRAENGVIDVLDLAGCTVAAGREVYASAGINKMSVSGGSFAGNITSRRNIKKLDVKGGSFSGNVWAETTIDSMKVKGAISNASIRAGLDIMSLSADAVDNSIISAARDIVKATFKGNAGSSKLLAGLDVGPDGAVGGGDDVLGQGNIESVSATEFIGCIISAGFGGGVDGDLLTDRDRADGCSCVKKIKGKFRNDSHVMAEGEVYEGVKAAVLSGGATLVEDTPAELIAQPYGPNVYGPGNGDTIYSDAGLTIALKGAGVFTYDGAGNLVLDETTLKSKLTITYTGAGSYATQINITGCDDADLGDLKAIGAVTIGNIGIDGDLTNVLIGNVANGASWRFGELKTAVVGQAVNLDVTAGDIGKWTFTGDYLAGQFRADNVGTFLVGGHMGAEFDPWSVKTVTVRGNVTGEIISWASVSSVIIGGSLMGELEVYCGDVASLVIAGDLSGIVNTGRQSGNDSGGNTIEWGGGLAKKVSVGGSFTASGVFRASGSIDSFILKSGNFAGMLAIEGGIKTFTVGGVLSGRAWAGLSIEKLAAGAMTGALVTASGNIVNVAVGSHMSNSYIIAGFDPGDAGYDGVHGGEAANLQLDGKTQALWRTAGNTDVVHAGYIKQVTIRGHMIGSTISGGVGPGADAYVGTADDRVAGTGFVYSVTVYGDIIGSGNGNETFGVFSACNTPAVMFRKTQPFLQNGNAYCSSLATMAGALTVNDVEVTGNSIILYLSHHIDYSSVAGAFSIVASVDSDLATAADNTDLTSSLTTTYDSFYHTLTLTYSGVSWSGAGFGNYVELVLADSLVDNRGNTLDGDFYGAFPTGDGVTGGDFVFDFQVGQVVLGAVPAYEWWFGCAPTAAGMLVGYYDSLAGWTDLIPGDATTQTAAVNSAIASSGDGVYTSNSFGVSVVTPGTPGTGHIPDYALYNGVDDYSYTVPYPDMSDLNASGAHSDDCIADFMFTSRSVHGATLGGSFADGMVTGIEGFFAYKGHRAVADNQIWGEITFNEFVAQIDAGKPMILGVDAFGDGYANHAIVAIGYDRETQQYACYDTWDANPATAVKWYDWQQISYGNPFGVSMAITVDVLN